jgi:serine/threonine protein kinase
MKIDNWSVGMIIVELLLGQLPVCYPKTLASHIKVGWAS